MTFKFPPPPTYEEFQQLCVDIYKIKWNDPNLLEYGRSGQKQFGIDIISNNLPDGTVKAVQCKLRSKDLKEKAILDDIELVKQTTSYTFSELVFATTALNDRKVIDLIRGIDREHVEDRLFRVNIVFWNELHDVITGNATIIPNH